VKGVLLVWFAVLLMGVVLIGWVLSLGALESVCDQGECFGKKYPIGRNVKGKKSVVVAGVGRWVVQVVECLPSMCNSQYLKKKKKSVAEI
jgi:hypothetical protein